MLDNEDFEEAHPFTKQLHFARDKAEKSNAASTASIVVKMSARMAPFEDTT